MSNRQITFHALVKSFGYAIAGITKLVRQEPNMRIHVLASVVAVVAGIIQDIQRVQWLALVFAIALVWIAEAFNTAIEMLCDLVCDNKFHPTVKIIKDISAGAVLLAAIASVVIALLVFF